MFGNDNALGDPLTAMAERGAPPPEADDAAAFAKMGELLDWERKEKASFQAKLSDAQSAAAAAKREAAELRRHAGKAGSAGASGREKILSMEFER